MQSPLPDPREMIRSGMDGRLMFNSAQRNAMLDAFEGCGVRAMSFARQHGLKCPTFISWLRKRRVKEPTKKIATSFAEVMFGRPDSFAPAGSVQLRVELPCGTILHVASLAAVPLAAELPPLAAPTMLTFSGSLPVFNLWVLHAPQNGTKGDILFQ